jgi:curved DNA-binding protein CbpA
MFMIDLGVSSYYSVLGVPHDADVPSIRRTKANLAGDLERQYQMARSPDEKRRLEQRKQHVNQIGDELSDPERRAAYDRANVHLTYFAVRKAAAPTLEEPDLRLRWMHQAVRRFLARRGEVLEPVSDLEREDFSADFDDNALLERLLRRGRRP